MSGTQIPMQVQPVNPFIGAKQLTDIASTEAGIGQTQAQTGLIGEQAKTANIQNQISGARLPFLMRAYGQAGAGQGGGQGGAPPGVPGAIGASGGQDWTGPNGEIMDPTGPFGQLGSIPHGVATDLMLAPPEKWADLVPKVREQKNQYVSQAIAETLDPSTGQADPAKWNQMIANEVQAGWMTASQARNLYGHPELAQTILQSTLPVGDQPATREAQAAGSAAGTARYDLVKTSVRQPDDTYQEVYVPKARLVGGSAGGGGGGAGGGGGGQRGDVPADLASAIQRASKVYDVPANDLTTMARIESGGDFSGGATSKTGAAGSFQFTGGTAASVGLENPRDNRQAAMGAARLWRENQADLTDTLGRPPASSEIYLAHQQGAAGATALLQAPRDALAVDVLKQAGIPPRNILVNGGTPTMTAGQFVDKWQQAWNKASGAQSQQGTQVAGPGAPTTGGTGVNAPVQIPPTGPSQPLGGGGVAAAGPPTLSPQMTRLAELDRPQIEEDAKANAGNVQAGLNANKAGTNMRVLRDMAAGAPTGSMADQRMAAQSFATQFGGPLGQRIVGALTGIDKEALSKMEDINKLALNNVVAQEQAVGPGTRIGAMFTNFFAKASPNINMQEPAIRQILNMGLVAQQMAKDYANASNDFFNQSRDTTADSLAKGSYTRYQTLNKLEGQWTADKSVHGPETYAAASNLLNGIAPSKAFKGLTNDQQVEAIKIVQRADPASMDAVLALRGK